MTEGNINDLLASYPRERPPLSAEHNAVYVDEYKINRSGQGLLYGTIQRIESWGHRQVAKIGLEGPILEIGAGTLNHLPFEPHNDAYDCIEPFEALYKDSPHASRVRHVYADFSDVPASNRYRRVVSVAVLEHLEALPEIVARSALVMMPNGLFQAVIPSEGGFLWGMSWRCSTGIAYRLRTGMDYKTVMRHEHINTATEIIDIVDYFFDTVHLRRFPLPWHHLSVDTYIEAKGCNSQRCSSYINSLQTR